MVQSRKIVCHKLSTNFRECTAIVPFQVPALKQGEVLIKTKYVGINASDINYTNGAYLPGVQPPFDCGFEALGVVVEVGPGVTRFKKGDAVASTSYGAFAEHLVAKERFLVKVPAAVPEVLPIIVCGLTASMALEYVGQMTHGETVLITAAAGATGQFAVQLAKLAGNHVIGTCSSPDKVEYLRSIGCDRPINYREEKVYNVLKKEYPRGVDLVFESVGGEMFEDCVNNIARRGRIIVIGAIAGYQDSSTWKYKPKKATTPLPSKLLAKSASVRGFFYNDYFRESQAHTKKLTTLVQRGVLNAGVDPSNFYGLEDIPNAIDFMYERKNIGKVIVDLTKGTPKL
ncbi:Prostaglandin reductase 3 [Phytophthora boehmeriae]|uniref:Prostaglandin reductase 3 n=1 Tax=Phytophthora boehmeriae TaxID=109152 RepID=A0A8T1WZ90_9STRA|nr:Prostaglandin reductase 3 [Phytophthora boehmeriae]